MAYGTNSLRNRYDRRTRPRSNSRVHNYMPPSPFASVARSPRNLPRSPFNTYVNRRGNSNNNTVASAPSWNLRRSPSPSRANSRPRRTTSTGGVNNRTLSQLLRMLTMRSSQPVPRNQYNWKPVVQRYLNKQNKPTRR